MKTSLHAAALAALIMGATAIQAPAQSLFGYDLKGSFGDGGFDRYVPPMTFFVLNETPFITTEVKPVYAYHDIPNNFVTEGGGIHAGAVQGRLALGDRFGIIATTDGYADVNFKAALPDTDGFLDLAAGAKYAVYSNPTDGEIITIGARYTAPIGNIDTAGIGLTGEGSGFLNGFVTGAKLFDGGTQIQGSMGIQAALSSDNWSYFHAHGHVDHEVLPGLFPLAEFNLITPIDGGDRIPGAKLTGADIVDLGASDPVTIFTIAGGVRYRAHENVILGTAIEGNLLDIGGNSADSVFGWRITTDLTIHF